MDAMLVFLREHIGKNLDYLIWGMTSGVVAYKLGMQPLPAMLEEEAGAL
jgi:hypothetical protein